MKVEQIIQLNCLIEGNRKIIQKELRKIKPLTNIPEDEIPLVLIEKVLLILSQKYQLEVWELTPDTGSSAKGIIWRASVVNKIALEEKIVIHGLHLYEVLAKSVLYIYNKRRK